MNPFLLPKTDSSTAVDESQPASIFSLFWAEEDCSARALSAAIGPTPSPRFGLTATGVNGSSSCGIGDGFKTDVWASNFNLTEF